MSTKLTLTIEKEVIEIAKEYAKEKGQSLSEMVENYFKLLTVKRRKIEEKELSPKIRKLRGIIKIEKNFDYKQIVTEELSKKYGWQQMTEKWKLNSGLVLWGGPQMTLTERINGPSRLKDSPIRYA